MQSNYTLQQICKSSSIHAAMVMTKFLRAPLKFDMKPIKVESIQKIDLPGHLNESAVSLFVPVDSSIRGGSIMLTTIKSALATCDLMLSRAEGCTNEITEIEESALKELANIVLGNFLTTFAHSLYTTTLMHSPATYEHDTSTVITKHIRSVLSNMIGENTVLNIAFAYEHSQVRGDINIFLDANKIDVLFKKMIALTNG